MKCTQLQTNKKAVSVMIGYVLLISISLVIAGVVYAWIKTYVPTEDIKCPDGVSIYIKNITCSNQGDKFLIELTLRNNGLFNIDGYIPYISNDSSSEIATKSISSYLSRGEGDGGITTSGVNTIYFNSKKLPGEEAIQIFQIPSSFVNNIKKISLVPVRTEIIAGKSRLVSCGNAQINEVVSCT